MKIGYTYKRTAETVYFCNYLMKQGVDEVVVDNGNYDLLHGLLNRLQHGDSIYVIALDHLSHNLDELKEILVTLYQKGTLLFVNGQYIDFDSAFAQMKLEKYFFDNRQAHERTKMEKAGE